MSRRLREERDNKQPTSSAPKNDAEKKSGGGGGGDDLSLNITDSWSSAPVLFDSASAAGKQKPAGGNYLLDNAALANAFTPGGPSLSLTRQIKSEKKKPPPTEQPPAPATARAASSSTAKKGAASVAAAASAPAASHDSSKRTASAAQDKKPPAPPAAQKKKPLVYVRDDRQVAQQERIQQAQQQGVGAGAATAVAARTPFDAPAAVERKQQKQQQHDDSNAVAAVKKKPNVSIDSAAAPSATAQQPSSKAQQQQQQQKLVRNHDDDDDDENGDAEQPLGDSLQAVLAPDSETIIEQQLHPRLRSAIKEKLQFTSLTYVQRASWPVISGVGLDDPAAVGDVIIRSETGSGKTLAYALPLLHRIVSDADTNKIDRSTGTLMIVLTPTRELAEQCSSVITKLLARAAFVIPGAIHGGDDRHHEKGRLRKGIHVLVSTPGRLLDHLNQTNSFVRDRLAYVVLDEADRLLDMGFERALREIMGLLPEPRKRVLVSATVTSAVERLSHFVLRPPIVTVGATEDVFEIPDTLTQRFVSVPAKHRLVALATMLWSRLLAPPQSAAQQQHSYVPHHRMVNTTQKIVVFVSTSDAVEFLFLLFSRLASPFAISAKAGNNNNSGAGGGGGSDNPFARAAAAAVSIKKRVSEANRHLAEGGADTAENVVEFGSDDDEHGGFDPRVAAAAYAHHSEQQQQHQLLSDEEAFLRGANVFKLHGNMGQVDRQAVYDNFRKSTCAVLFCTDVAARGLDIPNVDLIVHYDPPQDERCYVHRVGRTARIGSTGESVLFVMPHEAEYVGFLSAATKRRGADGADAAAAAAAGAGAPTGSEMFEMSLDALLYQLSKMDRRAGPGRHWQHSAAFLQKSMCDLVRSDSHVRQVSLFGYQSYIRAYAGLPRAVKRFFDYNELHLGHIAASFANDGTPAQLQRELKGGAVARKERDVARDAQRIKKHGVQIENTEEKYHSTLMRKQMLETKNRVDTGTASGLKVTATSTKAMTEFEA